MNWKLGSDTRIIGRWMLIDYGNRERWVVRAISKEKRKNSYSYRIPQWGSFTCENRCIFSTSCTSMVYRQVFRIMTWRPRAHKPLALLAELPDPDQVSKHYLVAFYERVALMRAYPFVTWIRRMKGKLWHIERINFHGADWYTVTINGFMVTTIKLL